MIGLDIWMNTTSYMSNVPNNGMKPKDFAGLFLLKDFDADFLRRCYKTHRPMPSHHQLKRKQTVHVITAFLSFCKKSIFRTTESHIYLCFENENCYK